MKVTATIDKPSTGKTLADLDYGVAATVLTPGVEAEEIRWRDREFVLGLWPNGRIAVFEGCKPTEYKVLEVHGPLKVKFEKVAQPAE